MQKMVLRYDWDRMNSTVAVVVTYNRKAILKKNIKCLLAQSYPCDVYIIDNASTDGTAEMVQSITEQRIYYFNTGANLGGAGGFEYGVRKAVLDGYDYVWIMDDDTLPDSEALAEFFKADKALNGKWGALSGAPYWTDGSICKANRQKKTLFTFVRNAEYKTKKAIKVTMASFVSLFVKAEVIKELGLPIGEYFIWTDDYEYTGRISKKYPLYVIPSSRVIHAMKENKKINFAKELPERIDRYQYVYRNDVHCYRQFGMKGASYLIIKYFYTMFNVLLNAKESKIKKVKVLNVGYIRGLQFHPVIKKFYG
ncbi:MAG: glycosyltransferase family 2 protein [Lachnospiraceae bacterium]|nr:glycosyltransferase family 2 protein [Lachnospiraceae bacterium]